MHELRCMASTKRAPVRSASKKATRSTNTVKQPAVKLLVGGNPQIAKGDGDGPVQAYIAAVPGWKRATCAQVDALITLALPKVQKAVKWNSPFYGVKDNGWFLSLHVFTNYVKVTFFKGASLVPLPPDTSTQKEVRYLNIREADKLDEKQFMAWVKQAARLPGWLGH